MYTFQNGIYQKIYKQSILINLLRNLLKSKTNQTNQNMLNHNYIRRYLMFKSNNRVKEEALENQSDDFLLAIGQFYLVGIMASMVCFCFELTKLVPFHR